MAVWAMAASLELAKFVLAAYVHQRWKNLNIIFKSYMVFAIVVLSAITSMGIFGFLSDAYQSASIAMDAGNIKLESQKTQLVNFQSEIVRLNKAIDEIPDTRISRKMRARSEAEPLISGLNKKIEDIQQEISKSDLEMLEIKKKVGPLIYVSRAFDMKIDDVVKYLILVFVSVFDPLAICLVIAMSQALHSRRSKEGEVVHEPVATAPKFAATEVSVPVVPEVPMEAPPAAAPEVAAIVPHGGDDEEMLLMRFTDEPNSADETKDKNGNAV